MSFCQNKVALVTGGASGIGLAVVHALLKNGARGVGIADFSEENGRKTVTELKKLYGDKAIFIKADVTSEKELEAAFKKTVEAYKHLDIVVNNVGIMNEVDWEKALNVNLIALIRGSYLAMDAYLPKYRQGEEGIIINMASVLGINTIESMPIYCTTKHGAIGFGKAIGGPETYKRTKVRVLTVCPGLTTSPLIGQGAKSNLRQPELASKEIPLLNKCFQETDHVGKAVIKAINEGKSGSFWVVEDGEAPYEVVFPQRSALKKK